MYKFPTSFYCDMLHHISWSVSEIDLKHGCVVILGLLVTEITEVNLSAFHWICLQTVS